MLQTQIGIEINNFIINFIYIYNSKKFEYIATIIQSTYLYSFWILFFQYDFISPLIRDVSLQLICSCETINSFMFIAMCQKIAESGSLFIVHTHLFSV